MGLPDFLLLVLLSHLVAVITSTEVWVVTVVSVVSQLVFTVTECVTVEMVSGPVVWMEVFDPQDDVGYVNVVVATCVEYTVVPVPLSPADEELAIGYGLDVPASVGEVEPGPAVTE